MNKSKNYERNVIKLGNSMAVTFPQEWFTKTRLKEHSKVTVFPLNEDSIIIHSNGYQEGPSILRIDIREWPSKLIEKLILTAFKLNIDKLYLQYDSERKQEYYNLFNKLQMYLIGIDSNFYNGDREEICIRFMLDSSKTSLPEILVEIFNIFKEFLESLISDKNKNIKNIYLEKFTRKYHLGMRTLLGTLIKYPSMEHLKRPIIQSLGDRITILYAKDVMDYAYKLVELPKDLLKKYSKILIEVSDFFLTIIKTINTISPESLWGYQKDLDSLRDTFHKIEIGDYLEETKVRGILKRYLSISEDLLELYLTRILESVTITNTE